MFLVPRMLLLHLFLLLSVVLVAGENPRDNDLPHQPRAADTPSQPVVAQAHAVAESAWRTMELQRFLQDDSSAASSTTCDIQTDESCRTNPDAICEYYNADNSSDVGRCECRRFGKLDTIIKCSFLDDCVNSTLPSCYTGTVERILDPQLVVRSVETCVSFPNSTNPEAVTCIRTLPRTVGNFADLQSCIVQYTPTGVDITVCHDCQICDATTTNTTLQLPKISFDCCNLQDDLRQSCSPVTAQGVGIPNFDLITTPGTCTSTAAPFYYHGTTLRVSTTIFGILIIIISNRMI